VTLDEIPAGDLVVIYGVCGSGKTHVAMDAVGKVHARDEEAIAVCVDTDCRGFSNHYVEQFGVDKDRIVFYETGEALAIEKLVGDLDRFISDGAPIKILVVNSVSGLRYPKPVPVVGPDGEVTDQPPIAYHAMCLSVLLEKLHDLAHKHKIFVQVVTHARKNISSYATESKPYAPAHKGIKDFAEYMVEVEKCQVKSIVKLEKE
jgi:RecA/RadA recombinase